MKPLLENIDAVDQFYLIQFPDNQGWFVLDGPELKHLMKYSSQSQTRRGAANVRGTL